MKQYDRTLIKCASLVKTKNRNDLIYLKFPYDPSTITFVKSLPNRKYHPDKKAWTCIVSPEIIDNLTKNGFKISDDLIKRSIPKIDLIPIPINGLKMELYDYQKTGVYFIEAKNGRALIADEMGLGKTIQSIAWFLQHPEINPIVIICPASLKINWRNEIYKWTKIRNVTIIQGCDLINKLTPNTFHTLGNIIIINYDIVAKWASILTAIKPKLIIMDEVHFIKNNAAKRTKSIKKLAKISPYIIGISGTPILNRPIEIFNAANIINPDYFPNMWDYAKKFCNLKNNGFGWDMNGACNTQELNKLLLSTIMIRRLKKDVLKELPDKIFSFVPIEIDNRKEYEYALNNFLFYLAESKGKDAAIKASYAEIITKIEYLKQLAVKGKLNNIIDWVENFLESGEKLVLFLHHGFVMDFLYIHFSKIAVKLDGSMSIENKQKSVDSFQNNDNIKLFLSTKAGGVGLNLTAASNVAIMEFPWTPGELDQWIARCDRIGQKNAVNVTYLLAENTIENDIITLLDNKRKILDSVLDGIETQQENLLTELLKLYNK